MTKNEQQIQATIDLNEMVEKLSVYEKLILGNAQLHIMELRKFNSILHYYFWALIAFGLLALVL